MNETERKRSEAAFEVWLGQMDAYKANKTAAGADAAMAAYYDWAVAMGVDQQPKFVESEMNRIVEMKGPTPEQKQRAIIRLVSDILAARKRAGKFSSEQRETFEGFLLVGDLLASTDKRPFPDRALAETYFNDMNFEVEEAGRLPPGQQQSIMVRRFLERYYDLAVHLRIDTLPGAVKGLIDKTLTPHGATLSPKFHKKLLIAARKRAGRGA